MKGKRAFLSVMLCTVIFLQAAACSTAISDAFDEGAAGFAEGKEAVDYSFTASGRRLEEMIDRYAGSYVAPSIFPMPDYDFNRYFELFFGKHDDQADEAGDASDLPLNGNDGDSDTAGASQSGPNDEVGDISFAEAELIPSVSSRNELLRLFHDAYDNTAESLTFVLTDGYTCDISAELSSIYKQLQREDPIDVTCVKNWWFGQIGGFCAIDIEYTIDRDQLIRIKEETPGLVDNAISVIQPAGKSTYEIVCAVNDYLCDTVIYPSDKPYAPETHTAYGALDDGYAVCEGYACAAKLLMNASGVECDIEIGPCHDGGWHVWNLVKVDGDWYQWDVTWNDGGGLRDEYLLTTDDFMLQSRSWDTALYPATPLYPYSVP